ncbi:hypothetical protein CHS0354_012731 [Potamilus streckersoni]|uniref:SAM-dependent MTase RsmB/NOP-type domain-containing protein n=1 Tax=Potamilus streckersoni TaxID=2493646 RepID=A0AAE0W3T4_9BIVA|nr:hypothetical protein CHS0354_012731 [Potamilus streckersoni]
MSPTAETVSIGSRTTVTVTDQNLELKGKLESTMRNTVSMMSGVMINGVLEEKKSSKTDYFYKEPCLYSHKVFKNASQVFSALRHDTKEEIENPYLKKKQESERLVVLPDIEFSDDNEKRLTFELAFETLKYQTIFEDLLLECSFFSRFPELMEDRGLVMVVLWDYQSRKFQQRTPILDEVLDPDVQQVEDAIWELKTKLNASLARHRIKAAAPSLEFLLSDKVRSIEEISSRLPVYVWVNQLKTSVADVIEHFKDSNYRLVNYDDEFSGRTFYVDCHCSDVLIFPAECREAVQDSDLLLGGHIVMQDKSSCLAPHSVKYLIGDEDDVIHVNAGSAVTTAHISSLMCKSSGQIWAFGANREGSTQAQKQLEKLAVKNVKLMSESFLDIELDDARFKNCKVVLVTANCSKSGISNPVDFIVNEGEDMKILKDLSIGETDLTRQGALVAQHGALLKHALRLQKVQAVVYMTRSVYQAENENVVTKAIEYVNMIQQRKYPFRVVPPVLPFSGEDIDRSIGITGKYIKFQPSERNSGCFVAVITREPEDVKETAKDVLARAASKGLLGGKKSKEHKESKETVNGDGSLLINGDASESQSEKKLLLKRSRKSPRKIHSLVPPIPSYHKPAGTSVVKAQISSGSHKQLDHEAKSMPTLITSKPRFKILASVPKVDKKVRVAEHEKVVKHPSPFR